MKRLGEMLLDMAAIDVNELHSGLEAVNRVGGRLGTQLLRFGFVTEKNLLEALSKQFGVPFIPESVLVKGSLDVRRKVPVEALRKFQAVPYLVNQGSLMMAMANPRDPVALEELGILSEMVLEPCVATEQAIEKALDELEGEFFEFVSEEETIGEAPVIDAAEWDRLWDRPMICPDDLMQLRRDQTHISHTTLVATFPGLTPLADASGTEFHGALDEIGFKYAMQTVTHKDEVADALLRFATGHLPRVCMFAVYKKKIVGWMGYGDAVVTEDVESLSVSADQPSVLRGPVLSGEPFIGKSLANATNDAILQCFGDPIPIEVVVVPISVKGRTVALMLGDVPGESAATVAVSDLVRATELAELAFEILILRNKVKAH